MPSRELESLFEISPSPSNSVIFMSAFVSTRVYFRIGLSVPSSVTVIISTFRTMLSGLSITIIFLSDRSASFSILLPLVNKSALYA